MTIRSYEDGVEETPTYTNAQADAYIDFLTKQLQGWEHQIKLGESLSRLLSNEDFEFVFTDYYLKDYLNNRLEDLASSISPELEQSAKDKVKAIGVFRIFLKNIISGKSEAENEIARIKYEIQQIELAPRVEE